MFRSAPLSLVLVTVPSLLFNISMSLGKLIFFFLIGFWKFEVISSERSGSFPRQQVKTLRILDIVVVGSRKWMKRGTNIRAWFNLVAVLASLIDRIIWCMRSFFFTQNENDDGFEPCFDWCLAVWWWRRLLLLAVAYIAEERLQTMLVGVLNKYYRRMVKVVTGKVQRVNCCKSKSLDVIIA